MLSFLAPCLFVTGTMELAMVEPTNRNEKRVARPCARGCASSVRFGKTKGELHHIIFQLKEVINHSSMEATASDRFLAVFRCTFSKNSCSLDRS
jgi:hypothetical protein